MAAEVNARHNKPTTIAFTLPISCQICLGKVKNPVLCPNHHVFCGPCMDVWLQKNKQCPACRVVITNTKKVIGGLSEQGEDMEKLTNPDLRRARFDILYKEYENEFERMHSEIQLLRTENQILKQQSREDGAGRSSSGESSKQKEQSHLLLLTKKLQDATKVYEKVKADLTKLKQENTNLKDENLSSNRENQHLRQELAGRSPHRFGRTTVSTLESKLTSAEKDVTRLTKALERSDKYIEELESELDQYRGGKSGPAPKRHAGPDRDRDDRHLTNGDVNSRKYNSDSKVPPATDYGRGTGADNPSRRQLFGEDKRGKSAQGERSKYYYEGQGAYNDDMHANTTKSQSANKSKPGVGAGGATSTNGGKKKVTFDLEKNTNSAISFDLELPSPLKNSANSSGLANGRASPVKSVLKKGNGKPGSGASDRSSDGYSTDMSKTVEDSLSESYNSKYQRDRYSKDDDMIYVKSRSRSSDRDYYNDEYTRPQKKYSADDSMLSEPSDLELRRARNRDYSKPASDYGSSRRSDDLDSNGYTSHRSSRHRDDDDDLGRDELDDTQFIESELDELNISLTPEFTDCMKILNRAEKNVHTRDSDSEDFAPRYRGGTTDPELDSALRASTGSMGYKTGSTGADDYTSSNYKPDTNRFTSSLDSYSRGRHVRSGSLDNLYMIDKSNERERPSSALPTTSNMYAPSAPNKYSAGLTTGRTSLQRTPSLDTLLISRPDPTTLKNRVPIRSYMGDTADKVEMKSSTGAAPLPASHDFLGSQIGASGDRVTAMADVRKSTYDPVLDARSRGVYSSDPGSAMSTGSGSLPPSGRLTPTLPLSSNTGMDHMNTGRITPTIPTHSEYMALSKANPDKYNYTSGTNSGRTTPTLTTTNTDKYNFTSTNTGRTTPTLTSNPSQYTDYRSTGPSSLPTDLTMKPPVGVRTSDPVAASRSSYSSSYSATNTNLASYHSASNALATNTGEGYSSLPSYMGTSTGIGAGATDSRMNVPYTTNHTDVNKYSQGSIGARTSDYVSDMKHEYGASSTNYISDSSSKYTASSNNLPSSYHNNDIHYKDGTDFSNFSTKVAVNHNHNSASNLGAPLSSMSSVNMMSASSTGSSSAYPGGSSGGYPGLAPSSSYLPSSSLTSLPSTASSSSSYATAISVPLTHTTSSYTSSLPANSYLPKPLDPIAETAGHFSYVSNMSGDYSSKNDTFALPEPKKRLFENSDDLEMSLSPIKNDRRF